MMKALGFLLCCLVALACTIGLVELVDRWDLDRGVDEMRQADIQLRIREIQERRAWQRQEIEWLKAAQEKASLQAAQPGYRPGFHSDTPLSAEQMLRLEREGRATFTVGEYAAALARQGRR